MEPGSNCRVVEWATEQIDALGRSGQERQRRGPPQRRGRRRLWRRFRDADRRRRPGHRRRHGARPDRLGARHRPADVDRRRRNPHRRGVGLPATGAPPVGAGRAGAAHRRAERRHRRLRVARPRQHRDAVEGYFQQVRSDLPPTGPGDLSLSRLRRRQQRVPVRPGLCDRARGRPSRAEPARHPAEGAAGAARPGPRGRQPAAGARRAAGGLLRRHLGLAREQAPEGSGAPALHRAGRRRSRDAHGGGHRRRHAATQGDRARGAGLLHPRQRRAAPALVPERLAGRHRRGVQRRPQSRARSQHPIRSRARPAGAERESCRATH